MRERQGEQIEEGMEMRGRSPKLAKEIVMMTVNKERAWTYPKASGFDGREQLVVYQFMDNGPDAFCPGCTHFTNNVVDLGTLNDMAVTFVTVSNMPLEQIEQYRAQIGWTVPFVSSRGNGFADDTGAGSLFRLSVFLRVDDDVYLTYSTTARGADRLHFSNNVLDLTPYGRRADWEDSPPGPQHPTYG
jgi:predicted dithiol-disulfide oxidoreductase (DUF899 family)